MRACANWVSVGRADLRGCVCVLDAGERWRPLLSSHNMGTKATRKGNPKLRSPLSDHELTLLIQFYTGLGNPRLRCNMYTGAFYLGYPFCVCIWLFFCRKCMPSVRLDSDFDPGWKTTHKSECALPFHMEQRGDHANVFLLVPFAQVHSGLLSCHSPTERR